MGSELLEARVSDLVSERPGRAEVLERFGIDYCCGGKKPLQEACNDLAVNYDEVLTAIAAFDESATPGPEIDWRSRPMTELADHIEATHHVYLRRVLPRVTNLLDKVVYVHGGEHPELGHVQTVFRLMREELEAHMMKEEQILFPMIRALEKPGPLPSFHCGTVNNPIHVMEHEHDSAGQALAQIRKWTNGFQTPPGACGSYRVCYALLLELETDLHMHIHKENNILFPMAAQREAEQRG